MARKIIPPTPAEATSPLSQIVEGRPGSIEGDIDTRMKNLLKDHQEMGARPKREPGTGDLYDPKYPLGASQTRKDSPKPK